MIFIGLCGTASLGILPFGIPRALEKPMLKPRKGPFEFDHVVVNAGNVPATLDAIRRTYSWVVPVVLGEAKDIEALAKLYRAMPNSRPADAVDRAPLRCAPSRVPSLSLGAARQARWTV